MSETLAPRPADYGTQIFGPVASLSVTSALRMCLTIKLSDRRWRAGLSVKDACEQPFRNERRNMAAVPWNALVRLIVAHLDGTN